MQFRQSKQEEQAAGDRSPLSDHEERRAAALDEILATMNEAGLTIADLLPTLTKHQAFERIKRPATRGRSKPPAKYRHPVSGLTWDGVGLQPDWIKRALMVEGYRVIELRCVDSGASDTAR